MNETAAKQIERALELRRREARARALADMAVAVAFDESRELQRDKMQKPLELAHDVALLATSILIERIYSEDRELAELRSELAACKERMIAAAMVGPMVIIRPHELEKEDER